MTNQYFQDASKMSRPATGISAYGMVMGQIPGKKPDETYTRLEVVFLQEFTILAEAGRYEDVDGSYKDFKVEPRYVDVDANGARVISMKTVDVKTAEPHPGEIFLFEEIRMEIRLDKATHSGPEMFFIGAQSANRIKAWNIEGRVCHMGRVATEDLLVLLRRVGLFKLPTPLVWRADVPTEKYPAIKPVMVLPNGTSHVTTSYDATQPPKDGDTRTTSRFSRNQLNAGVDKSRESRIKMKSGAETTVHKDSTMREMITETFAGGSWKVTSHVCDFVNTLVWKDGLSFGFPPTPSGIESWKLVASYLNEIGKILVISPLNCEKTRKLTGPEKNVDVSLAAPLSFDDAPVGAAMPVIPSMVKTAAAMEPRGVAETSGGVVLCDFADILMKFGLIVPDNWAAYYVQNMPRESMTKDGMEAVAHCTAMHKVGVVSLENSEVIRVIERCATSVEARNVRALIPCMAPAAIADFIAVFNEHIVAKTLPFEQLLHYFGDPLAYLSAITPEAPSKLPQPVLGAMAQLRPMILPFSFQQMVMYKFPRELPSTEAFHHFAREMPLALAPPKRKAEHELANQAKLTRTDGQLGYAPNPAAGAPGIPGVPPGVPPFGAVPGMPPVGAIPGMPPVGMPAIPGAPPAYAATQQAAPSPQMQIPGVAAPIPNAVTLGGTLVTAPTYQPPAQPSYAITNVPPVPTPAMPPAVNYAPTPVQPAAPQPVAAPPAPVSNYAPPPVVPQAVAPAQPVAPQTIVATVPAPTEIAPPPAITPVEQPVVASVPVAAEPVAPVAPVSPIAAVAQIPASVIPGLESAMVAPAASPVDVAPPPTVINQ